MKLHTSAEAAAILRVSESYLSKAATAHALPHTRVGRKVLWSDDNLAAIVAAGQVAPARTRRVA